jgi:hypothetical protein
MEYHPTNKRQTYDDAAEGAATDGLRRCCKPFDMFGNLWDPQWNDLARERVGVKVFVKSWNDKTTAQWRRWSALPLDGEQGIVPDSPNRDKYVGPQKVAPPVKREAETRVQPAKTPLPQAGTTKSAATSPTIGPESILVIRPVRRGETMFWVVNTSERVLVTESEGTMRELENAKARGQKLLFVTESAAGPKGAFTKIVEFTVAK